jgi:hemoglobin-like flavoprotein
MSLPGGLPTNQGALEQGLGNSFTTEMRDAWTAAYVVLANAMKDASRLAA